MGEYYIRMVLLQSVAQAQSAKHVPKTAQRICRVRKSRLSVTIHRVTNFR